MLNLFIMSLVQDPSIRELRSVNKECAIIRHGRVRFMYCSCLSLVCMGFFVSFANNPIIRLIKKYR